MTDAMEVPMCACGDAWHEHNAANHAPTCRVLAAFATLTRERDAAREELRDLNEAWSVMNDSHIALRAERDAAERALAVVLPYVRVIREQGKSDVNGVIHGERDRVSVGGLMSPPVTHSADVLNLLRTAETTDREGGA